VEKGKHSTLGATYLLAVPLAGIVVLVASAAELHAAPPSLGWLLLTALTALTGAYTIKIPGLVVRLSVSEPTVFLSTLLFGPAAGAITAAVDALVISLRLVPRLRTLHRVLFNVGTVSVAVYVSGQIYFNLAGLDTRQPRYGSIDTFVGPLYVFAGGVFAINSWLVALALAFERGTSPIPIWRTRFLWLSATYLASASIAAILVTFTHTFSLALVGLLLPLILVSFVAVRTTLGRLDDANTHLTEVNQLYLSTIETLAMAIDAKDQVTHGHIRRVQRFAVELARVLGMTDDRQLKAIEAAALLHDMGKLAIPEFILNKPGKLTSSEFDLMKTHAALGADILSSIHFPYPVVPIVRHHHENWDGSGYPDGLHGPQIPIGARILSVVDCFDALTSDRPYRAAMTDEQAVVILTQRRGRMYDPLVVDAFVDALPYLKKAVSNDTLPATLVHRPEPQGDALPSATTASHPTAALESLELLCAMAPFPSGPSASALARQALSHARAISKCHTATLFVCDPETLDIVPLMSDSKSGDGIVGTRMALSERLTGWVAAYRSAVWNSAASLDLGDGSQRHGLVLASAIPLLRHDSTIGVLTLYGRSGQEVSLAQRKMLEDVSLTIAESLWDALQRSPLGIEGRRPEVRAAALSALEAILSHSDSQHAGVVFVATLSRTAADSGASASEALDLGLRLLLAGVLTHKTTRQFLVLSDDSCVIYEYSATREESLHDDLNAAVATDALQPYEVELTRVSTSLELQMSVQRIATQSRAQNSRGRSEPTVH